MMLGIVIVAGALRVWYGQRNNKREAMGEGLGRKFLL